MAQGNKELMFGIQHAFNLLGHAIECRRQNSQLVLPFNRDFNVQVAFSNLINTSASSKRPVSKNINVSRALRLYSPLRCKCVPAMGC
jgi:hypothetical protein